MTENSPLRRRDKRVLLSVIMPAYNEEGSIVGAVVDVKQHIFAAQPSVELLVIDDGSTDATAELLAGIAAKDSRVRVVSQENSGHGAAVMRGLQEAEGEIFLLLDSDRQIRLDEFGNHLTSFQNDGLDALLGIRKPRQDPAHRLVITRLMRLLIGLMFSAAPRDAGVPYKLVRRSAWNRFKPLIRQNCWIPSVLIALIMLRNFPYVTREVTVTHLKRESGTSTLNVRRLTVFCAHAVTDLFDLRRRIGKIGKSH